jgi:hypothetical protein
MLKLNKKQILNYQKNRDPYLMIDFATKVIPGVLSEDAPALQRDFNTTVRQRYNGVYNNRAFYIRIRRNNLTNSI